MSRLSRCYQLRIWPSTRRLAEYQRTCPAAVLQVESDVMFVHQWLVSIAYGFAVVTDVILTGALVFVLQKSRINSSKR